MQNRTFRLEDWMILIGIAIMSFMFGLAMGYDNMRKQAIEHGAAQYNSQTRQFEWIKTDD